METKLLLLLLMISLAGTTYAQDDTKKERPYQYFNYFGSGGLVGQDGRGTTFTVSTIHGVRTKNFAVGLGLGYDDYTRSITNWNWSSSTLHWKVVPVYLSVSRDLIRKGDNHFFMQMNAGHSVIRLGKSELENSFVFDLDGGTMINPMIGYRMKAGKYNLYLSGGYKWQKNHFSYYLRGFDPGSLTAITYVKERIERFTFHVGFGWN